jgi:hypothetical protein
VVQYFCCSGVKVRLPYATALSSLSCISVSKRSRVVGPRGIYIGPGYIKDIKNWPRPKNKKEVERFLVVFESIQPPPIYRMHPYPV